MLVLSPGCRGIRLCKKSSALRTNGRDRVDGGHRRHALRVLLLARPEAIERGELFPLLSAPLGRLAQVRSIAREADGGQDAGGGRSGGGGERAGGAQVAEGCTTSLLDDSPARCRSAGSTGAARGQTPRTRLSMGVYAHIRGGAPPCPATPNFLVVHPWQSGPLRCRRRRRYSCHNRGCQATVFWYSILQSSETRSRYNLLTRSSLCPSNPCWSVTSSG